MDSDALKLPAPETLFAATLYLTAQYAKSGCPNICCMIMRQLMCILNHPSESVPPTLRETCRKMHAEWRRIAYERTCALQRLETGGAFSNVLIR